MSKKRKHLVMVEATFDEAITAKEAANRVRLHLGVTRVSNSVAAIGRAPSGVRYSSSERRVLFTVKEGVRVLEAHRRKLTESC